MGFLSRIRRRRRETERYEVYATLPLPSDEPEDRWRARLAAAGLRYVGLKRTDDGSFYLTLAGGDAEAAKRYLRAEPVEREFYYIVVETPVGEWGTDIHGIYLEKLQDWQRDTRAADCDGRVETLIDSGYTLAAATLGWTDIWVAGIVCGRCRFEWIDGLRFRDLTLVRCPSCGATNRVDARAHSIPGGPAPPS